MTLAINLSNLANYTNSIGKLDASQGLVNIAPVANGGTGVSTASGVLYGNGTLPLSAATGPQLATAIGSATVTNATNAVNVTGTVAVGNGGTGLTTLTNYSLLVGAGTSPVTGIAPGANENVLISNGTSWTSSPYTAIGALQSWTNVTSSRALSTNYTNSTTRPIVVMVQVGNQANGINIYQNGTLVIRHWYDVNPGAGQVGYSSGMIIAYPGDVYQVTGGPIRLWWELR